METPLRIAFVCPRMTNLFSRVIWYSLQESARREGVRLTAVLGGPLDHPHQPTPSRRLYDLIDPSNFDGVLLYTASLSFYSNDRSLKPFLKTLEGLPVVSLGGPLEGVTSVAIDQARAIEDVVDHLHEGHGYRRFAFLTGPLDQVEARQRHDAFLAAMRKWDVPSDHVVVLPGNYSRPSGAQAVQALEAHGVWPWALVCSNDESALGAFDEARRRGLLVPSQLAITGFDDVDLAALHDPSLTSVSQPFIRHAGRALTLLLKILREGSGVVHEVERARVAFRESCGCPPLVLQPVHDKAELFQSVLGALDNVSDSFREFAQVWLGDYVTAFEYLLETGNPSVLRAAWADYFRRVALEQDRGLSFRRLFRALEGLFGHHPRFGDASRENLVMAGASEARKGSRDDQNTRRFFFLLHDVELSIGQINDAGGLQALPVEQLRALGIAGLALVRHGVTPRLLAVAIPGITGLSPPDWGEITYPRLLPDRLEALNLSEHRLVVGLASDQTYLGYIVFWMDGASTYVGDFLANQFSGTLQRLELLEQIREQSQSLQASLEESRRVQEQLVETEKVAGLGRLVAGVAHEINTPLGTGITGTSFLLERLNEIRAQLASGQLARSALEQFLDQGKSALEGTLRNLMKAGELIQAFKGLGPDHGRGEWRPVDLGVLFGDLGSVYEGELLSRGIVLRREVPPLGTLVYAQPSALVQVAGELIENAMEHAFPPGSENPQILLQVSVSPDELRVAVTDNGRGLTPDERRHLFDPLYTTQRPGGHAGLGLHLAFQLVTRTLGGHLSVASEAGGGTCFLCVIPLPH